MAKISWRLGGCLILLAVASACRPVPADLSPNVDLVFSNCLETAELSTALGRYLSDNAFEVLDRVASARMTGQVPVRVLDIVAVDARDDVIEVVMGPDPSGAAARAGFALRIRAYHRPGFPPDGDLEARLTAYVTGEFGCRLGSVERADSPSGTADLYRSFVRHQRHVMSRYR